MGISTAEYNLMVARLAAKKQVPVAGPDAVQRERDLHANIIAACRLHGWLPFNGAMIHRTFRTPGEPDFVVLADRGRTFLIEAKSARGKLSMDQLSVKAEAERLGHTVHIVHSMREFYGLLA